LSRINILSSPVVRIQSKIKGRQKKSLHPVNRIYRWHLNRTHPLDSAMAERTAPSNTGTGANTGTRVLLDRVRAGCGHLKAEP
jgi:hypothetical protein